RLPRNIRHIYLGVAVTRGRMFDGLNGTNGSTFSGFTISITSMYAATAKGSVLNVLGGGSCHDQGRVHSHVGRANRSRYSRRESSGHTFSGLVCPGRLECSGKIEVQRQAEEPVTDRPRLRVDRGVGTARRIDFL